LDDLAFEEGTGAMIITLLRTKQNTAGLTSPKAVFVHRTNWMICPFHALACYLITNHPNENEFLFSTIQNCQGPSSYVNQFLNQFSKEIRLSQLLLTSHSNRRGPTTEANAHPGISVQWLVERGDWTLDSISTMFEYITGTSKTDRAVGRALSGWANVFSGGKPPKIELIPNVKDRSLFQMMAHQLIPHKIQSEMKEVLFATFMMHLQQFEIEYPFSIAVQRITVKAKELNISSELLYSTADDLHSSFNQLNLKDVALDELPGSLTSELEHLKQVTHDSVLHQQEAMLKCNQQLFCLQSDFNDVKASIANLTSLVQRLVNTLPAQSVDIQTTIVSEIVDVSPPVVQSEILSPENIEIPRILNSLQSVTISKGLCEYFIQNLERFALIQLQRKQMDKLVILRQSFERCKKLCSTETMDLEAYVACRPPVIASDEYTEWLQGMTEKANKVQKAVLCVLNSAKKRDREVDQGPNVEGIVAVSPPKRFRKLTGNISAAVRHMKAYLNEDE
jgi:hypothetical protein